MDNSLNSLPPSFHRNVSRPRNHTGRDSTTIITDHNEPDSDEDARPPARKRKNNYLAEDDEHPQKKQQASSSKGPQKKEKHGVPIGIWTLSDEPIDEMKHVVYGFFDNNAKNPAFRMRIYPERKDGTEYWGNMPQGTGRWAIKPENLLPDPHLRRLSEKELAEYVRLRILNFRDDETPAERKIRDDEAVAAAILKVAEKAAGKSQNNGDSKQQSAREANEGSNESPNSNTVQTHKSADGPSPSKSAEIATGTSTLKIKLAQNVATTPVTKPRQVATPQSESTPLGRSSKKKSSDSNILPGQMATPQSGSTPSGGSSKKKPSDSNILLGWWKKSEAVNKEDKHVVYGVIQANSVFRIKVVQENIRGERFKGNFPTNPGGCWIPYDDVLLISYLEEEGFLRTEIEEYARICFADPDYRDGDQGQAISKAIQVAKRHVQDMARQAGMDRLEYDKKRCGQLERDAIARENERQRKKISKNSTAEPLWSVGNPESSSLGITPVEDNSKAFDGVGQGTLTREVEKQPRERQIVEMPPTTAERMLPALGPSTIKNSNVTNAQTTHDADGLGKNDSSGDIVRPPKKSRHMEAPGTPRKLARRSMNSYSRTEYFSQKNQRDKASPNSKADVDVAEVSLQTGRVRENRRQSEEMSGSFGHSDAARRDPKRKSESLDSQRSMTDGTNGYARYDPTDHGEYFSAGSRSYSRPMKRPKSSSVLSSLGANEPGLPPALSPLSQSASVTGDVLSCPPKQDVDGPTVTVASVIPSASTMRKYTTIYPNLSILDTTATPATCTASGTSDPSAATPANPASETTAICPGPVREFSGDQIAPVHTAGPVREAVLEARSTAHQQISREASIDPMTLATQAMEAYRQPRQETTTIPRQMLIQYKPSTPAAKETSQSNRSESTGDSLVSSSMRAVPATPTSWVAYQPKAVLTRPQFTPKARAASATRAATISSDVGTMRPSYLSRSATDMPNSVPPHTSGTTWNAVNRPLRHPSFETARKSSDAPAVVAAGAVAGAAIPPATAATRPNPSGEVIGRTPVTPTATPVPDITGSPHAETARKTTVAPAVATETPGVLPVPVSAANMSLVLQVPVTSQSESVRENQVVPDRPAVADFPHRKPVQENPIGHVTLVASGVQQAESILGTEPGRESLVPLINPVAPAVPVVREATTISRPQLAPDSLGASVRPVVSGRSEIASVLNPEPVQETQVSSGRQSTTLAPRAGSAPLARLAYDENRDPRMSMQRYLEEPSGVQTQSVTTEQALMKAHKERTQVQQPFVPPQLPPQPPQTAVQEPPQPLSQPQTQLPPQPLPQTPVQESTQLLSQPQTNMQSQRVENESNTPSYAKPTFVSSQSSPVVPSSDEIVKDRFGDEYSMDISGLFEGLLVGERQPIVRIEGGRYVRYLVLVPKNHSDEKVQETAHVIYDDNKTEYRRSMGLFQDLFVGVDSEMVRIGKERYIKYVVLEPM